MEPLYIRQHKNNVSKSLTESEINVSDVPKDIVNTIKKLGTFRVKGWNRVGKDIIRVKGIPYAWLNSDSLKELIKNKNFLNINPDGTSLSISFDDPKV
jgi:hypothetical protein